MSPPPTVDDLVPATTSGSGKRRRSAAWTDRCAASASLRNAANSPRVDVACSTSAASGGSSGLALVASMARIVDGSMGSPKKADSAAWARARSVATPARSASRSMHLTFGAEMVESGSVSRGFSFAQHVGQPPQPVARRRQLALSHLRRDELGEGQPQIGARPPQRFVRATRTGINPCCRRLLLESAATGDREHLTHHQPCSRSRRRPPPDRT